MADDLIAVLAPWCAGKEPGEWVFTNRAENAFRGVPVAGVQAALGHSPTTTLSIYTHLWPASDEVARAAISGAVSALNEGAGFWFRGWGQKVT